MLIIGQLLLLGKNYHTSLDKFAITNLKPYTVYMDISGAVDLSKKARTRVVEETDIGVYIWEMPDGSWVADEDGNWMLISAKKGDIRRISQISDAAKYYGVEEGRAVFLPGHRAVSEEEYQGQKARFELGLVPDAQDSYSQIDDMRNAKFRK